ncbi:MAG: MCE family protein [Candidatus Omnitrophica bacterium]|nr:MCE family protein [Candidatus Omnitrophota bacterium]
MHLNNETKIGLMVMAGVVILFGLTVKAGNFTLKKDGYRIKTDFSEIDGVSRNSPVMLNGLEVGVVEDIQIKYEPDQTVMELTLWLKSTAKLKQGTHAMIKNLGFMGEKYIGLTAGDPHGAYLGDGALVQGQTPVDFNQLMGDGHELLDKAGEVATDIDLRLKSNQKNIDEILSNFNIMSLHLQAASANLEDMSSNLKKNPWKLLFHGKEKK